MQKSGNWIFLIQLFLIFAFTLLDIGVNAKLVTFQVGQTFQQVSIKKNENLDVSCNADQHSTQHFCMWEKDGPLKTQENLTWRKMNCTLELLMADVDEHDGNWMCTVFNGSDNGSSNATVLATKVIQVTVLSRPIGPSIVIDGKEKKHGSYVPVNPTSSIMCRVIYGNPAASLSFQVNGVDVAGHTELIDYDSTKEKSTDLYLTQHFESSWYGQTLKCVSRHPAYVQETMDTYVHLQRNVSSEKKTFAKEPEDVIVNEGDNVTFECITEKPFTTCLWEKDGWTVPSYWNYNYSVNNSYYCAIEIKKAGNYIRDEMWRCMVGNATAVEISREAKLTVLVKPMGPLISVDGLLQLNGTEVHIDVHRRPRIQCHSGSGKPAADLSMTLDGRPLRITHEISKRGFIFASKLTTESTVIERIDSTWFDKNMVCSATHPSFGNMTRSTYVTIREDNRMGGVLFEKEPQDLLVSEDEKNVTLDCVTEEPVDSCYWELDSERIASSSIFKYNRSSQDCSVTMSTISFYMNDGYYKCVFVKDLESSESKMVKISVAVRPNTPMMKLKMRQLNNDSDVVLQSGKVELTCESSFGYPAATMEWRLDGELVDGRYEIHKYFWSKKETAYLILTAAVEKSWYGKSLQCVAKHQLFDTSDNTLATSIRIRSPITNAKACFDSGMLEFDSGLDGDSATMYCLSQDNPLVRFRWERRSNQSDIWRLFRESQNVTVIGISGEFSCVVTNKFEAVRSKSILSIFIAPSEAIISSSHNGVETIEVQSNETVKLSCQSEAYPSPKYRWEYKTGVGEPWRNFSFSQNIGFEGVMGQFACVAYNRVGLTKSKPINILIPHTVSVVRTFGPGAEMASTPTSGHDNENVTLHCLADGSPPPKYKWETRQTEADPWKTLEESQNVTVQRGTDVTRQYSCVAWNDISSTQLRSPEIVTIVPQRSSDTAPTYDYSWIVIVVTVAVLCLLVIVTATTVYTRRRKDSWNVVASVRRAFGGEIVSERLRMNDDDDDEENVAFETSSLAPLN